MKSENTFGQNNNNSAFGQKTYLEKIKLKQKLICRGMRNIRIELMTSGYLMDYETDALTN